jgi:stalled ribosome alternative rescue factor ArfA
MPKTPKIPGKRNPMVGLVHDPMFRSRIEKSTKEKEERKEPLSRKAKHKKHPLDEGSLAEYKQQLLSEAMNKVERSKLRKLAYTAIERDSLSSDPEIAERGDAAFTQFSKNKLSDEELRTWATRETEFRLLSGKPENLDEFYQAGDKVKVVSGPLKKVLNRAEKLRKEKLKKDGAEPGKAKTKAEEDSEGVVREPKGPSGTIGITIDGKYHLCDEEDVELIYEAFGYVDLTEWSYAETTSGINIAVSSEENDILKMCAQPVYKKNMDDREQEVARRMVSRGVLHRHKDDEGIYFVRDNEKLTRF